MLCHEFKKLYIKQSGLLFLIVFLIAELFFMNAKYPENEFSNENTAHHFEEYMQDLSGRLTPEKENLILSEQEKILDAQNDESLIMRKLWDNEYENESDFLSDMAPVSEIVQRSEAFKLLFAKYNYAKENPEDRYILSCDYKGMTGDYPDIMLTLLVIVGTALLFINEESSRVITIIRISENGMSKTLYAKYLSLLVLICSAHLFSAVMELAFILLRGDPGELSYPLQSVEFFQNCPYKISIIGAFLCINTIKFLGYLFLSSLIILLSVTLKNPLLTVFIPGTICVLQQFLFSPATPAYYLPTGLLRAVGYFRGNSEETINQNTTLVETVRDFTEIPLQHLVLLLLAAMIFCIAVLFIARRYYEVARTHSKTRKSAVVLSLLIIGSFSGCGTEKTKDVIFNANEAMFFAQNEEYYYISDKNGVTAVSKSDGTSTQMITDAFSFSGKKDCRLALCADYLYYHDHNQFDNSISRISLSQMTSEIICSASEKDAGFLGLSSNNGTGFFSDKIISSFFSDGKNIYFIFYGGDGVYKLNGNTLECVISDTLYSTDKVCFDGQRIYFINRQLKLKSFDIVSETVSEISGEFTKALYYDGTRLLYSNMNGIFALDPNDNTVEILSEERADEITSDGNIVVFSQEKALYMLDEEKKIVLDYEPTCFAIIPQIRKLFVRDTYNDADYKLIALPL